MAHYAKIENGIVTQVIVAEQDFIDLISNENDLWVQTSYNTRGGVHYKPNTNEPSDNQNKALRKNYAGVGYVYNKVRDAFIPPQPFNSWLFNEQTCLWEPPIDCPNDGNFYQWNEQTLSWDKLIIEQ